MSKRFSGSSPLPHPSFCPHPYSPHFFTHLLNVQNPSFLKSSVPSLTPCHWAYVTFFTFISFFWSGIHLFSQPVVQWHWLSRQTWNCEQVSKGFRVQSKDLQPNCQPKILILDISVKPCAMFNVNVFIASANVFEIIINIIFTISVHGNYRMANVRKRLCLWQIKYSFKICQLQHFGEVRLWIHLGN